MIQSRRCPPPLHRYIGARPPGDSEVIPASNDGSNPRRSPPLRTIPDYGLLTTLLKVPSRAGLPLGRRTTKRSSEAPDARP
jgi:hypothetical protein